MTDKLMTVDEVAEYLRVKASTVHKWAKDGKVPAAKVGGLQQYSALLATSFSISSPALVRVRLQFLTAINSGLFMN